MSENFYLSFSGERIEELKAAVNSAKTIDELELECLTEEIVEFLIQAQVPIQTLIIEEAFVDGALMTKLLSSLSVGNLVFPGYDACEAECCCDEEFEEPKEELKFKGLNLQTLEDFRSLAEELLNKETRVVKFKECHLSEEVILRILSELIDGELEHLEKISISKDPKATDFLKEQTLPAGIALEPKKKDGITILKS